MLYLIKGRAGSGKTAKMREIIEKIVKEDKYEPLLIIPDQFSFETDRIMLQRLGAKDFKKLDIFSFTRLSHSVLKSASLINKAIPDSGIRLALMNEALQQLEGNLNIFNDSNNILTLQALVEFSKELKLCKISQDELSSKTDALPNGFLKEKLKEINLINEGYNALVEQSFFDDTNELDLLCEYAQINNLFKNKIIFIDGFRDFSKQEFELISVMMSQAKDVYVTLCINEMPVPYSSFYFIKTLENSLRTIANNCSCTVDEIKCIQDDSAFTNDIFTLEKNINTENTGSSFETDNSVIVTECTDKDNECKFVAAEIKRLVRTKQYRCRDIVIIERVNGTYKDAVTEELKRLDVPVFEDSRRSLSFEPLFIYLNAVLMCVTGNLNNENIFAYLKTGFSPLSLIEISVLEKYALMWGVGAGNWVEGFTAHPDGFGNEFNKKSENMLKKINSYRQKVIAPVWQLKNACKDKTGTEVTELIYNFLVEQGVPDKLYDLYSTLLSEGFPVEANRQSVSWDRLVHILDSVNSLTKDKTISLKQWYAVYKILVSSEDIGEIPQGLDEITIGSADRIRTEKKKVCFLVGVNKEEFPLVNVKNGVLSDNDRVLLTDIGLPIRPPFKDTIDEERFIAYCAVTAANERLYLSYKTIDSSGEKLFASEIVDLALSKINGVRLCKTTEMNPLDLIESDDSAFSALCEMFNDNTTLRSTLLEYFKNKEDYPDKIKAINSLIDTNHVKFQDEAISTQLFGEDMNISASKVEAFYKCPFSYFMRYGMKAEPLKAAEMDSSQSGKVIHTVMENLLKKYPKREFCNVSTEELKDSINEILTDYINSKLGGVEGKTSRFMFLYNHLLDICIAIAQRLKVEFSVGSFEPCGFEVKIGDENIPPYEVQLDNGTAKLTGYIDRVDTMEKDGITYLRVIDYKSGTKEFKLCNVIDGLNIQMILYLMALEKNGGNLYGDFIPSAFLYLPSKIGFSGYMSVRNPKTEEVLKAKQLSGKLSGMILDSPVVMNGMGVPENPDYFPVGFSVKNNKFTGNIYNQRQFKNISLYINSKIKKMGDSLHNGCVEAIPMGKSGEGDACKYCSYKPICGYESGDDITELSSFRYNDALKILGGDDDE